VIRQACTVSIALAAFALQGCAAALVPVAAGGVLIKTRVDAAKRTRKAEASMEDAPKPVVIVGNGSNGSAQGDPITAPNIDAPVVEQPADDLAALPIPEIPGMPKQVNSVQVSLSEHPYRDFARYALAAADKREAAISIRSAVLTQQVSLADPKTIPCDYKPLAVIFDLDTKAARIDPEQAPKATLAEMTDALRQRGIKLIWLTDKNQSALPEFLGPLRSGQIPAIKSDDLISYGANKGKRKQERRWKLAQDYCIIAVAGDAKSDFDELYDYLRNPEYAIRLDAFWDRGWFVLPPPLAVIGGQITETTPEVREPR
jgi:hypothetical protein